jgi:hypothetical protein
MGNGRIGMGLVLTLAVLIPGGCRTAGRSGHSERIDSGGPPPHAPARGYRAKHVYRYYHDVDIYRDEDRGGYWYMRNGEWEFGARLPSSVRISGGYVTVETETDKPYTEHEKHRKAYPPGQEKRDE